MKITVTSSDGVQLWTYATIKGGAVAVGATERELRDFAATKTAPELREDDYFDLEDTGDFPMQSVPF